MAMRRTLSAALLCAALLSGCQWMMGMPHVGPPPPRVADDASEAHYQEVLGRWTRRAEIYEGLDSRAFFVASLETMELRQARVERLSEFRGLPQSERAALLEKERAEHANSIVLFLAVHVNERRFDDFSRKGSMWHLALVGEGGEVEPISVEKLGGPDPNLRALYPYLEDFWVGYRLKFPRALPGGRPLLPLHSGGFELSLSSAVGRARLNWSLPVPADADPAWP